jgi:hypothetical protein
MTTGTRARRAALLAAAGASVLALSACEKPSPGVSVFSGTSTEHSQALCWSFDGASLDSTACAQDVIEDALRGGGVGTIPVVPGETIGISVDPTVAREGWTPVVGSQRLLETPTTSTYYRFTFPDLQEVPEAGLPLQVVAGQGDTTVGIWIFRLVPRPGIE